MKSILTAVLLTASLTCWSADIYTWKDAKGVTHFANRDVPAGAKKVENKFPAGLHVIRDGKLVKIEPKVIPQGITRSQ